MKINKKISLFFVFSFLFLTQLNNLNAAIFNVCKNQPVKLNWNSSDCPGGYSGSSVVSSCNFTPSASGFKTPIDTSGSTFTDCHVTYVCTDAFEQTADLHIDTSQIWDIDTHSCITPTCANGANNHPVCNQCSNGYSWNNITSSCNVCENGGCTGLWPTLTCNNGAIDPPICTPPPLSGNIISSSPTCTILENQSSCSVNLTWHTISPVGISAVTRNSPTAGEVIFTANNRTNQSVTINGSHANVTYYLYNDATELDSVDVTAFCISGSVWNGVRCIAQPTNSSTLSGNNTLLGTINVICGNSTTYSIVRTEGSSGIYPIPNTSYTGPVSKPVTVSGNYIVICSNGSLHADLVRRYSFNPPTPRVYIKAAPTSVTSSSSVVVSWSILNPGSVQIPIRTCKLTAKAVCPNGICNESQLRASSTINNIISTGYTDANDSAGSRRISTVSLNNVVSSDKASGKKTFILNSSMDFLLNCGNEEGASELVRVLVTSRAER